VTDARLNQRQRRLAHAIEQNRRQTRAAAGVVEKERVLAPAGQRGQKDNRDRTALLKSRSLWYK